MPLNKETEPNLSTYQVDLFENYLYLIGLWAKNLFRNNYAKNVNINV